MVGTLGRTLKTMVVEASIPVRRPLRTMPVFSSFSSGFENRDTMGIKICGVTEQMPVMNEPAIMASISVRERGIPACGLSSNFYPIITFSSDSQT